MLSRCVVWLRSGSESDDAHARRGVSRRRPCDGAIIRRPWRTQMSPGFSAQATVRCLRPPRFPFYRTPAKRRRPSVTKQITRRDSRPGFGGAWRPAAAGRPRREGGRRMCRAAWVRGRHSGRVTTAPRSPPRLRGRPPLECRVRASGARSLFGAQLIRRQVGARTNPMGGEPADDRSCVCVLFVAHGDDGGLFGGKPDGEGSRGVFDIDARESARGSPKSRGEA